MTPPYKINTLPRMIASIDPRQGGSECQGYVPDKVIPCQNP
jgi:hypothetical protein